MEDWIQIKEFPKYEVSNLGNIRNRQRNTPVTTKKKKNGYPHVGLYKNGKRINKYVHRLVAENFCNNGDKTLEVNHIDGNKQNNSANNLEWCTKSYNALHAFQNGLRIAPISPNAKKVKIEETGDVYNSIRECVRSINGDRKSVYDCLRGHQQTHKGLHIRYVEDDERGY